jgi:hypothetical protein
MSQLSSEVKKIIAAGRPAGRRRADMKKAIPVGMALFAPHTLSGILREPMPASEGFAFN